MRMRAGFAAAAAAAAALSGCVVLPMPPPWQVGGGVSRATVYTDYSALGDQSANGVAMVASWGFTETWWFDTYASFGHRLQTGTTENIYYPPDSADYGLVVLGLRKEFRLIERRGWAPWLSAGVGVGDVSWDTYFYGLTGVGMALGAGIDAPLGQAPLALRAQLLYHRFSADDTYDYGPYHVTGVIGSLLLVWTIGDDDAGH